MATIGVGAFAAAALVTMGVLWTRAAWPGLLLAGIVTLFPLVGLGFARLHHQTRSAQALANPASQRLHDLEPVQLNVVFERRLQAEGRERWTRFLATAGDVPLLTGDLPGILGPHDATLPMGTALVGFCACLVAVGVMTAICSGFPA
jgi:hypothetical protein